MKIEVDLEGLDRSKMGGVTAPIYLAEENSFFPEEKWSDFPLIVLSWWGNEFCQLIEKKVGRAKCDFMDGCFGFDCKLIDEQIILIECWEEIKGRKKFELNCTTNWNQFLQNYVEVATHTATSVKSKNWHLDANNSPTSDDLSYLESRIKQIQIYLDKQNPAI